MIEHSAESYSQDVTLPSSLEKNDKGRHTLPTRRSLEKQMKYAPLRPAVGSPFQGNPGHHVPSTPAVKGVPTPRDCPNPFSVLYQGSDKPQAAIVQMAPPLVLVAWESACEQHSGRFSLFASFHLAKAGPFHTVIPVVNADTTLACPLKRAVIGSKTRARK